MTPKHTGNFQFEYGVIKFEGLYSYVPGEKRVNYFRDGSGHPGCDPEILTFYYVVTSIDNEVISKEAGRKLGEHLENVFQRDSLRIELENHIMESFPE